MDGLFDIPDEIRHEECLWATLCHVAAFAVFLIPPVGHIILPLILWLLKRHDSVFIDDNGREALNFQISITIYAIPCFILVYFLIGIPLLAVLFIFWFITIVYAAIKTNDGVPFRYPFTIRIL